jgi:hypothetical protein
MTAEPLHLRVIRRGQQVGPELLAHGDPTDAQWMHDHLVNSIKRDHDASPDQIGEYVMEIWSVSAPRTHYATFAEVAERPL